MHNEIRATIALTQAMVANLGHRLRRDERGEGLLSSLIVWAGIAVAAIAAVGIVAALINAKATSISL